MNISLYEHRDMFARAESSDDQMILYDKNILNF